MRGGVGIIGRHRNAGRALALVALTLIQTIWACAASAETYSFVRSWPQIWGFSGPRGVAVDGSGSVYVADSSAHCIYKLAADGTVVAKWGSFGVADGQFWNPQGVTVDDSGSVYVADSNNHRIQKFTSSGAFVTKWGSYGTGDGQFYLPSAVSVSASGSVYVVDSGNYRIQKFTSSGVFLGQWGSNGSGDGQFGYPGSIVVDTSGSVYVTDLASRSVQKFTSSGAFVTKWGSFGTGDGQFNSPSAVCVNASGSVYVVDSGNYRIQEFTSSGAFVGKWGANGRGNGQFTGAQGIAVDTSGNLYVADPGNQCVQKFTSSGSFLLKWGNLGSEDGQFWDPHGMAFDASGNVYVADTQNHRIQKFSANGAFLTKWGSSGSGDGQLYYPWDVAVDTSGNVYVADAYNHRIQKFTATGVFLGKWGSNGSGDGQFSNPRGIALDSSGNVYVADTFNDRIQKFTASGTFLAKWGNSGSDDGQLSSPHGIAIDASDNVYVVESGNVRVQKFTSSGAFVAIWGTTGIQGSGDNQFFNPYDVAVDTSGNVYVVDGGNQRVQKFSSSGDFLGKWGSGGSGNGEFYSPRGLAVDASGDVFVTDTFNHRIQQFSPMPPAVTAIEPADPNPTNASLVNFTVTFNRSVTGVDINDFTLTTSGVAGTSIASVSADSGDTRTVTVGTGAGNGSIRLDVVDDDSVADSSSVVLGGTGAGNGDFNTGTAYTVDKDGPAVTLSSAAADTVNASIAVTVTLDEASADFDAGDIVPINATVSDFSGSGTSYSYTLTPVAQGAFSAVVNAGACADALGNLSTASNVLSRTFDSVGPLVALSSGAAAVVAAPVAVTVTLNEASVDFTAADVSVINATVDGFAGSGTGYSFTLTPTEQGDFSAVVNAGTCTDAVGNANSASNTVSYTFDSVAPTVALASTAPDPTNASPIPLAVTFSEPVTGFEETDLTVTGGTVTNFAGTGSDYTADLVPSGAGTVTVSVVAGAAQDAAGNASTASAALSREYDSARPTVSMTSPTGSPTNAAAIAVTVTFSKAVTGFDAGDVSVVNAALSGFTGSGASYGFTLTPAGDGEVTAEVAEGAAQDAAGNLCQPGAFTRTIDRTPPVLTLVGNVSVAAVLGLPYVDAGATAVDAVDGDLTGAVAVDASGVDTAAEGHYLVYYAVTDAAGNTAQAQRNVQVLESVVEPTLPLRAWPVLIAVFAAAVYALRTGRRAVK